MKKQVRNCDILVGIIVFFVIAIHMMTGFFIQLKSNETGADIEQAAAAYESNIFMIQLAAMADGLTYLIFFVLKPAIVIAVYYMMRRSTLKGKMQVDNLMMYVVVTFFVLVVNFLNDFSILAGYLAKLYGG